MCVGRWGRFMTDTDSILKTADLQQTPMRPVSQPSPLLVWFLKLLQVLRWPCNVLFPVVERGRPVWHNQLTEWKRGNSTESLSLMDFSNVWDHISAPGPLVRISLPANPSAPQPIVVMPTGDLFHSISSTRPETATKTYKLWHLHRGLLFLFSPEVPAVFKNRNLVMLKDPLWHPALRRNGCADARKVNQGWKR